MIATVQRMLSQRVAHTAAVSSNASRSAMQRRVDKSDPKDASAAQSLSIPPEWTLDNMSGYTVLLSAATMALSMAVVSPYPDLSALGMLLACAQLVNQRPRSSKKEKEGGSNAISSFMLATAMSSSLAFTKLTATNLAN